MKTSKVLSLQFACENGKKYNVRIKDANSSVTSDQVQQLADVIVKSKAFDFDGNQTAYTFKQATYTTTNKNAIVAAK